MVRGKERERKRERERGKGREKKRETSRLVSGGVWSMAIPVEKKTSENEIKEILNLNKRFNIINLLQN